MLAVSTFSASVHAASVPDTCAVAPQTDALKYTRKNAEVRPFEAGGEGALEHFSRKTDAALFALGSSSKKRPHNLVLGRFYDHRRGVRDPRSPHLLRMDDPSLPEHCKIVGCLRPTCGSLAGSHTCASTVLRSRISSSIRCGQRRHRELECELTSVR